MIRKLLTRLRWSPLSRARLDADQASHLSTTVVKEIAVSGNGDPLSFFDPEPPSVESDVSGGHHRIALDQVLDRAVTVSWPDAVAILDAVCAAVIRTDGGERVPEELSGISITEDGTVIVEGGESGAHGPRLARILLALTAAATVPVPLRLFITKWVSFTEEHTVADYAMELAHFAPPNGTTLIQALFQRAIVAAPAVESTDELALRPPMADLARRRWRPQHLGFAAGAAAVSAAAATTVWLWMSAAGGPELPPVEPLASARAPSVEAAYPRDFPSLDQPRVLPRPRATPTIPGAVFPVVPNKPPVAPRSLPNVELGVRPPAAAPTAELRVAPGPFVPTAVALTTIPPAPPTPETSARPASALSATSVDRSRIYSDADPDVTPPTIIEASLPPPLLADSGEVNTMELVISERGHVERVRLISKPRRMADMMLLSGAKNWRFEPASKDGRFVKYRLRLSWAATP